MSDALFDHEKLRAYQEAVRFVAWVDPIIERLPRGLPARDQLDRAAPSSGLNRAEGNGQNPRADRCRFLPIARESTENAVVPPGRENEND
jgi:four helix bundle protein